MSQTRIAFADANWLVAAYHRTKASKALETWAAAGPSTLVLSSVVLAEAQRTFWRLGDRWPVLDADVKRGKFVPCGYSFETLVVLAEDLFPRYAARCNVGTLDLMHLAAARRFGCQWFLSFDSNSGCRALASVLGMKLFPELSAVDKAWIQKLKS